jgi:hypothetical protein
LAIGIMNFRTVIQMKTFFASLTWHFSAFLIAFAGLAGPARCDLSPSEAWSGIVGLLTDLGVQILASPESGPNGEIRLNNLRLVSAFPGGQVSIGMEVVSLRQRKDGNVELIYPDSSELHVGYTPQGRNPLVFEPKLTLDDLSIIISGKSDDFIATLAAGSVNILLDVFPEEFLAEPAQLSAVSTNVSATFRSAQSDQKEILVSWSAADGTLEARMDSEWSPIRFAAATGKQSLEMALSWPGGGKFDTNLSSGFTAKGVTAADDIAYRLTQKYDLEDEEPGREVFSYSVGTFSRSFDISKSGMKDDTRSSDVEFTFDLGFFSALLDFPYDWPYRLRVRADQQVIEARFPTVAGNDSSPYAWSYELSGLTLADKSWARIDPGRHLPRDPGQVLMKVTGLAKPDDDFVAGLIAGPAYGFPGRFLSASLDRVEAEFLGVSLTAAGTGDVVYDTYDQATFVGALDVDAAGLAGLIGKIGDLGGFEPEQLDALLPMLETYAKRSGPDDYRSLVDFGPGGTITANGIPLFGE